MSEISVIIPVFNVEDYLRECLDSVCNQSFKDIEIICVNDGSTDGSLDILNEYSNKDERIMIVSQDNQGLGASRNNGLKIAGGNYIYFMDADDYIELDTLEKLHDNALSNDSDMVLFKFQIWGDEDNLHNRGVEFRIDEIFGDIDYSDFTFNFRDVKVHVLNSAFSACLKLYKKDFLDSYDDFHFPENLAFEDVLFHVKAMVRASRLSFVNEALYYYRSNPTSILNSTANEFDIFDIVGMVESFLKDNGYYDELEDEFIYFKIAQILVYVIFSRSEEYFSKVKEEVMNLEIKNENTLKKHLIEGCYLVLLSDNYEDYVDKYYRYNISRLNEMNKNLREKNRKLRQLNEELRSSNSMKLTKPLRCLNGNNSF